MALPKFYKVVQDQQGNIVPQVLGSVYNQGTGVLASLYQDDGGTIPLANPMTSDAQYGSFKFYVNPGHYDLTFTKPGYTFEPIMDFQVPEDVLTLGTMAQQDANAVTITGGTATGLSALQVNGNIGATGALTVTGQGQFGDVVGIRKAPVALRALALSYANLSSMVGIALTPQNGAGAMPIAFLRFDEGVYVGNITTTDTATSYNTSSDRRLKEAIAALPEALATLMALRPVAFRWRSDGSPGVGFIADEVQAVVPQAVSGEQDAVDAEGRIVPQGLDASKLIPYLVSAVQALLHRVEALEARLA